VVDDERAIRDLLQTSLPEEGYEIIVASNGAEVKFITISGADRKVITGISSSTEPLA
jgi:DNA-binding response OmpR family regulator